MTSSPSILDQLAAPLDERTWRQVNQRYLARSIGELLHERMVDAEVEATGDELTHRLTLTAGDPRVRWRCRARRRALQHWNVDPTSIVRELDGRAAPADAAQLFIDLREAIGSDPSTLTHFLEETAHTLYADACIAARGRPTAAYLAEADHQTVEAAMEGHPWVLVNKGRIGMSATELGRMAPESAQTQRLLWLAVHRERATFHALPGIDHDAFMDEQLGTEVTHAFRTKLSAAGGAAPYWFVPVNEWQWNHKLAIQLAGDLATQRIVPLGVGPDEHRPQQSIRTYQSAAHPRRCYVKTALSILNTFQIRGLDPRKLRLVPSVTAWLRARLGRDPELERTGVVLLGEVASVAYEHPLYRQVDRGPYQFREMLGALWRESPLPYLSSNESAMTMAALLYVDDAGDALVAALARRAGLDLGAWVSRYLDAYLTPILHCFYRHETFFVAHGENTILVLDRGAPTRVIIKDLVEEVQVSRRVRAGLSDELKGLVYDLDDTLVPLHILTDVFDGFFRYLGDVLATHCDFPEARFWRLVADAVRRYQAEHPELAASFARIDLFCERFPCYPLNKYRLVYHGYAEAADNVHDLAPRFAGDLANPLAEHR